MTQCMQSRFQFPGPGKRQFEIGFDGGPISSDGGLMLLARLYPDALPKIWSPLSKAPMS